MALRKSVQDIPDDLNVVRPAAMSLPARKRLSGPALRTFKNIADRWRMDENERLMVLGRPARATYYGWVSKAEKGADLTLPLDVLLRISAVLGVYKDLTILFEDSAEALRWLRGHHGGPPFSGQAPIDLMLSGTHDGLLLARRYLDAWRGGTAAQPSPSLDVDPVTKDDLVFA